jgi:hypothetical protein
MKRKTANIDIRVEPQLVERIDASRARQRVPAEPSCGNCLPARHRNLKELNVRTLTIALAAAALFGCAQNAHIYPLGLFGQRIVGNSTYVSISNVWNEMDGLPLAESHCAEFGKSARFTHMEGHRAIYDCIKG